MKYETEDGETDYADEESSDEEADFLLVSVLCNSLIYTCYRSGKDPIFPVWGGSWEGQCQPPAHMR